jgi:hypothetical protein
MVVGAGIIAMGGANVRKVLDPRDVGRTGTMQIAAGEAGWIER